MTVRLGPFLLEEPVGIGGMGEVWRGRHAATGMRVAAKMIKPDVAGEERFRGAFLREVESVTRLDHPGVVLVFDHGEVDGDTARASQGRIAAGSPYLVTEFASGGSLDHRPTPRDWPALRGLLLAVLDALAHAHAHGVVHLDLKPGKLLHCRGGDYRPGLKLTDFGLAQAIQVLQTTKKQRISGTPQYMAPEQFGRDGTRIGPWTDLYALGCVAWELACGTRVFAGPSIAQLRRDHLGTRPGAFRPRIQVPDGFEAWIRMLLSKTPLGRFEHAADAAWALLSLGEAVDFERTTIDLGLQGAETFAFQTFAALSDSPPSFEDSLDAPLSQETPRWTRPPTPRGWRAPLVARPVRLLHDAGSSLFGLRTVPYVGRDQLRDRLWDSLRDLDQDGLARAVVFSGVSGVGKTRLGTWLGRRAAELGAARFLTVHYAADEDITTLLAREFGREPDPRERIPALQGELAQAGRSRPVILLLDDCADAAEAASFARRVIRTRAVQEIPVLIVLTVEALTPRIEKLLELDGATHEPVEPLGADASHLLVRGLLALDEGLAGDLEFRAAGNPEYAIQLIGDWVRRGLLEPTENGFNLRAGAPIRFPDGLREMWTERLEPLLAVLDEDEQRALELGALLESQPKRAEWEEACAHAGLPSEDAGFEELLIAGLAGRTDDGWVFQEALVRELLVDRARERDWTALNAACARLESLDDERRGLFLAESGQHAEAVPLLVSAAKRRCQIEDYARSIHLCDRAEQSMDLCGLEADSIHRFDSARRRLVVLHNSWELQKAAEGNKALLKRALKHDWPTHDLHALLSQSMALQGQHEMARWHVEEALDAAGDDTYQRAQVLSIANIAAFASKDIERARVHSEEARLLLLELGDTEGFSWARNLNDRGEVARLSGDHATARACYEEAARICRNLKTSSEYVTLANLAMVLLAEGDVQRAREVLDEAIVGAQRTYGLYPETFARGLLFEVAARQGDLALWDKTVHGFRSRYEIQPFSDNDFADSFRAAGELMLKQDPRRARFALEFARDSYVQLGRRDDANAVDLLLALTPRDTAT